MRKICIPLTLLALLTTTVNASPIYKWVDKQGAVHYTAVQPIENTSRVVQYHTSALPSETPDPSLVGGNGEKLGSLKIEATELSRKQTAVKLSATECATVTADLTSLRSGIRRKRQLPSGETEVLDDKTRSEEIQKAENVLKLGCS